MTKSEIELNNNILEQSWNNASPERVSSLLERLNEKNKLKLASVAIADTDLDTEMFEMFGRAA